eukprot:TRINITY_DN5335_c0_g1_i4.p1 TRINITY_DN5335_c0_g1~~TRINITY_DN5335_c0_g1_i4.p1  ORF type:complete len:1864 (-),score=455.04 TRINITY_DN5335_c0_g1_i4:12-5603(-)
METKLDRLFILLEGSNPAARKAAAEQIGAIQKAHPYDLWILLERVHKYLYSKNWDTRLAAGHAIEAIVRSVPAWEPPETSQVKIENPVQTKGSLMSFKDFDIVSVLKNGTVLLASGGQEFDMDFDGMDPAARLELQRQQIKEKLGLFESFAGQNLVDDSDLLLTSKKDKKPSPTPIKTEKKASNPSPMVAPHVEKEKDELQEKIDELESTLSDPGVSSRVKNSAKRKLKDLKKQQEGRKTGGATLSSSAGLAKSSIRASGGASSTTPSSNTPVPATKTVVTDQPQQDSKIVIESVVDKEKAFEDSNEWPFKIFASVLMNDLFNANWETRHGAATGLRAILKHHAKGAGRVKEVENQPLGDPRSQNERNKEWLEDCAIRVLCLLTLDRFTDFVSDNVVTPVKETSAQILGTIASHLESKTIMKLIHSLTHLQQYNKWEARHSGYLGVKYLVAVRSDLIEKVMPFQVPIILKGLKDKEDDVRMVAADTLLPMVSCAVQNPDQLGNILGILWNSLNEIDDLTASTNSIMKLLSEFYSTIDPSLIPKIEIVDNSKPKGKKQPQSQQPQGLLNFVPRLWPFFRHNILSVRLASINTLYKLLGSSDVSWLTPILSDSLRYIFQNIVLDIQEEVVNSSLKLWDLVLSKIPTHTVGQAIVNHIPSLIKLVCTQNGHSFDRSIILQSHFQSSMEGDDTNDGVPLCDRQQATKQTLSSGCKALGKLASYFALTYTHGNPFLQYIILLLNSNSATSRQVSSIIFSDMIESLQSNGITMESMVNYITPNVSEILLNYLVNPPANYYEEILPSLQLLHQDTLVLAQSFTNLGIDAAYLGIDLTQFILPAVAQNFIVNTYPHLFGQVPKTSKKSGNVGSSVTDQLEARRGRVENRIQAIEDQHQRLDTSVNSSMSEAFLHLNSLPDVVDPIVKPLMRSIKSEDDTLMQRRSARALALFIRLCIQQSKINLTDPILNEIVTLLRSDPGTPVALAASSIPADTVNPKKRKRKDKEAQDGDSSAPPKRRSKRQQEKPQTTYVDDDDDDIPTSNTPPVPVNNASIMQSRGGNFLVSEIAKLFDVELFSKLPLMWTIISRPLQSTVNPAQLVDDTSVNSLTDSLHLLTSLVPVLSRSLEEVVTNLLPSVISLVAHPSESIRDLAAKCIEMSARASTISSMHIIIDKLLPILEKHDNLDARLGAARATHHIIVSLDIEILPWIVFLMIPIMGRMSDPSRQVREAVTFSFATLIKLMPLEAGIPDPPGMAPSLIQQKQKERRFLEQLLDGTKLDNYDLPIKINTTLRRYQQDGVNWLAFLNKYNLHGILCDDMGLGKTLQSLCIVASDHIKCMKKYEESKSPEDAPLPSLVICPPTIVQHWCDEIKKFCDSSVKCVAYIGSQRTEIRSQIQNYNIIVMSYQLMRNDIDLLENIPFNYAVLDEGHVIRNSNSKLALAAKRLKARHRLILSGTPIQNNVLELWSLFDFLMPGFLGDQRQFADMYSKPILQSRGAKASSEEQERGTLALEALHRQVLPFILRRVKEDVLHDLPPKIIQDYYCELSPLQAKLYNTFSNKVSNTGIQPEQKHIFNLLQYLRKLCTHPKLVFTDSHPDYSTVSKEMKLPLNNIQHAPKFQALKELLRECGIGVKKETSSGADDIIDGASNHRALIFCQMRSTLDIIEEDLFKAQMPNVTYFRMDGTTPTAKRQPLCKKFNEDPTIDCFLLTTTVGGLGLNLTGADTVIFMEHDWNPMKDLQAMDRAHRIGTKRTVNVYRLITRGTLEEKIMGLQKFKLNIANSVVNKDNQSFANMDTTQLLDLFSYNSTTTMNQSKEKSDQGVDALGNVTAGSGAPKGMKAILDSLDELWDESQYTEEYNLDNFIASLKN